ncbi:LysR family transcriptional regulator [Novosphingobium mangrovi (ex Huang et al. 2023)]|uniref:LysR family transcriptional regulator n=1 Tax=Novosphingobium mangrovi (ex Huang et al. 2023) TaxID=2976432 RepID=A0ABT2I2G8_9SPHN|nr:LysR family transcriptional regulator [Novosphingobium mangrovi (ex Huang et al. 2023)]MCT2398802.1 LysR family transcriptional regulator [Novosphingobium mangrovi (ex Huang et al. 2023)]
MIKRAHIRQFLAVVEAGSFTQAAARIHVTQPTLSLGISELERLVGTRLFIRDRKRVRLTAAGGRFIVIARDLERGFKAADTFGQTRASEWPDLKIGLLHTIPDRLLEAIMGVLGGKYSMELVEGTDPDLRTALGQGRIQVALTLLTPDCHGSDVLPLFDEPYVMLVPSDHALAGKHAVPPDAFSSEVMIARRRCEVLTRTSRFFTRHGVRPRFSLRTEDDERAISMIAAGLGITVAPLSYCRPGMEPVEVSGYDLRRRIGLRCAPNALPDAVRQDVFRTVREACEDLSVEHPWLCMEQS